MYQVNNRIRIESEEQQRHLVERFRSAPESMKKVPGFVSFRLLKAEDGSHLLVETIFESKEDFIHWTQSEHFKRAHDGRSHQNARPDLSTYEVLIP